MPCPLFEPLRKIHPTQEHLPRLPLIYEFEGICHAGEPLIHPLHRFHYCNRGNAKGNCPSFPNELALTAIRLNVTGKTPQTLTIVVVEEESHWPRAWASFSFLIAENRLEPEIEDSCRRAQVFQFCLSYLEKLCLLAP
jgi:hypothetical protein